MEVIKEIKEIDTCGFQIITNKQVIMLLIDDSEVRCKSFGYFWCNENYKDFIDTELFNIVLADEELNFARLKEMSSNGHKEHFEGCTLFVNFETSNGILGSGSV